MRLSPGRPAGLGVVRLAPFFFRCGGTVRLSTTTVTHDRKHRSQPQPRPDAKHRTVHCVHIDAACEQCRVKLGERTTPLLGAGLRVEVRSACHSRRGRPRRTRTHDRERQRSSTACPSRPQPHGTLDREPGEGVPRRRVDPVPVADTGDQQTYERSDRDVRRLAARCRQRRPGRGSPRRQTSAPFAGYVAAMSSRSRLNEASNDSPHRSANPASTSSQKALWSLTSKSRITASMITPLATRPSTTQSATLRPGTASGVGGAARFEHRRPGSPVWLGVCEGSCCCDDFFEASVAYGVGGCVVVEVWVHSDEPDSCGLG